MPEKRGMGEMSKVTDPWLGKSRICLEQRSREGGQAAGKVHQAVVRESVVTA